MIVLLCGLSGAGKTTLATLVQNRLRIEGIDSEVLDGDEYRKTLCSDLGFSKEDRQQNVLRMAFVAHQLSKHGIISILSAINPFAETRAAISDCYPDVKTVFVDCPLATLLQRDTKGLYHRAMLPEGHPDKLPNLTGVNDPFEAPENPDLHLDTGKETKEACVETLLQFIRTSRVERPTSANYFSVPARVIENEKSA